MGTRIHPLAREVLEAVAEWLSAPVGTTRIYAAGDAWAFAGRPEIEVPDAAAQAFARAIEAEEQGMIEAVAPWFGVVPADDEALARMDLRETAEGAGLELTVAGPEHGWRVLALIRGGPPFYARFEAADEAAARRLEAELRRFFGLVIAWKGGP